MIKNNEKNGKNKQKQSETIMYNDENSYKRLKTIVNNYNE